MFTDVDQVAGKMAPYTIKPYTVVTSALVTKSPITELGLMMPCLYHQEWWQSLYRSPGCLVCLMPHKGAIM